MKMIKNMGFSDRLIRVIMAVILLLLTYSGIPGETVGIVLAILASIFLLTAIVGTCPLYFPLGISTLKK